LAVAPATTVGSRYDHLNREEMLRLLEARDQRDAIRFGLVWEANEIERDKALNNDFVALTVEEARAVNVEAQGQRAPYIDGVKGSVILTL
jgi:hypothetical protein